MRSIVTRFRAYQLGEKGASFSHFADGMFTLIEARLTEMSRPSLEQEMKACGVERLDTLHITSWDRDHCNPDELEAILFEFRPKEIECPGYNPSSDSGKRSLGVINDYSHSKFLPSNAKIKKLLLITSKVFR